MLAFVFAVALGAAAADAATYCVSTTGCDPAHTKSTVLAAVTAASGDGQSDLVRIGPGSFDTNAASYTGSHALTIHGAGRSETTLRDDAHGGAALICHGKPKALLGVGSLTVQMGSGTNAGILAETCPVHVDDVEVNTEFAPSAAGIVARAGTSIVTQSTVLASETRGPFESDSIAVLDDSTALDISDSTLLGQDALIAEGNGEARASLQAHRLTITTSGFSGGAVTAQSAEVSIDDSLIKLSAGATGLTVFNGGPLNARMNARQLTVIHSDGTGTGMFVNASPAVATEPLASTLLVRDSIFAQGDGSPDTGTADVHCEDASGGTVRITIDYTDFAAPVGDPCSGTGTGIFTAGSHNVPGVNPRFTDPSGEDYTLSVFSPLRLRDPSPLAAGESPTDLLGEPRIRGGLRDLGAYEYQPPGPGAVTGAADRLTFTGARLRGVVDPRNVATSYHFVYGRTAAYGHRTPALSAGSGKAPVAVSALIANLRPGHTYHFRLIADNGIAANGADRKLRTPRACVVPQLIGKTLRQAHRTLSRARCRLGKIGKRGTQGAGERVISQSPKPGRLFRPGHRVNVIIGRSGT